MPNNRKLESQPRIKQEKIVLSKHLERVEKFSDNCNMENEVQKVLSVPEFRIRLEYADVPQETKDKIAEQAKTKYFNMSQSLIDRITEKAIENTKKRQIDMALRVNNESTKYPHLYEFAFDNRCGATSILKEGFEINDNENLVEAYAQLMLLENTDFEHIPQIFRNFEMLTTGIYKPILYKETEVIPERKKEYNEIYKRYQEIHIRYFLSMVNDSEYSGKKIEDLKKEINYDENSGLELLEFINKNYKPDKSFWQRSEKEYPISHLLITNFYIQQIITDPYFKNFNDLHPYDKEKRETIQRYLLDPKLLSVSNGITKYLEQLTDKIVNNELNIDLDSISLKLLVPYLLFYEDRDFLEYIIQKLSNNEVYKDILEDAFYQIDSLTEENGIFNNRKKLSLWLKSVNESNEVKADDCDEKNISVNNQVGIRKSLMTRQERMKTYVKQVKEDTKKREKTETEIGINNSNNKIEEDTFRKNYKIVLDQIKAILSEQNIEIPKSFDQGYMKKIKRDRFNSKLWRLRPTNNDDGRIFVNIGDNLKVLDVNYFNKQNSHKPKFIESLF